MAKKKSVLDSAKSILNSFRKSKDEHNVEHDDIINGYMERVSDKYNVDNVYNVGGSNMKRNRQ